ncbi:DNA-dependent metalloprotease SPRTN-like [Bombina bombina]|uniref:DNA-dependent metalloprotease SPRTN-like n=1 Tax=Bombina bombina TaxID=8345 RepID=UPI00235B2D8E|nr:DNA-dependent metalloprotease SPRTN-like [Bombina bombina]
MMFVITESLNGKSSNGKPPQKPCKANCTEIIFGFYGGCAGLCSYQRKSGKCTINLSKPLLKRRSRKDLIESLLHEMIHAYLCINNIKESDMHGPVFCSHMQRINTAGRFHITTYHTFHKEIEFYDNKWYRCDGPCNTKKPYYGFCVPYSCAKPSWWDQHKTNCGGKFKKVQRPDLDDLLGKSKP